MRQETYRARVFKTAILAIACSFAPAKVALANIAPAVTFTAADSFNNVEADSTGWAFNVSAPIWVSALGYYDYSADPSHANPSMFCCTPDNRTSGGLLDNHIVGIFNSTGTLLTSTTVPSGTAGTLVGDSRYTSIPTIELTPGQYFVEGTEQGTVGANPIDPVVFLFSGFSTLPEINSLKGVASLAGGPGVLAFGNGECCGYEAYIGPNFLASNTAPTPEPDFRLLLTGGLAGLWLFCKRHNFRLR